ncbi:hypothetical protein MAQ5080_03462 [Marinomonas aquimarina]|uniref:Uncharacterized protein n=1 Tax=Marinomonas aquimarina TaxID=295068 RepID=A0A1A8TSD7_9GAMM|nr:hypothetical protein MAQ5080_03462 [Marinomonas aquimarina]
MFDESRDTLNGTVPERGQIPKQTAEVESIPSQEVCPVKGVVLGAPLSLNVFVSTKKQTI